MFANWPLLLLLAAAAVFFPEPLRASSPLTVVLRTTEGKDSAISDSKLGKFLVFVASGSGCPVMRQYIPVLNKLHGEWGKKGVSFFLVNVSRHDTLASIKKELREYKPNFLALWDEKQEFARRMKFKVTSEVAVWDVDSGKVVYSGAIDDQNGFEGRKPEARRHYLRDALAAVTKGEKPKEESARAFGCAITLD